MAEEIKYRNLGAFSSAGGFNVANADPIDSRQLVATIGHIYQDGNWDTVKPYPGLIVSAADSGEVRVYVGPAYDKNQSTVKPWTSEDNWKKIGGGATQVAKYSDAVALIETSEVDGVVVVKNLGQVIYVTGTETIGEAPNDVTYEPGAYIISGATSLSKLGTTTASGNLANDVAVLQGKVSTVEGKVSTLEGKVSTLEGEMDAVEGRLDTIEAEFTTVEGAKGRVVVLEETAADHETRIAANETFVSGFPTIKTELENATSIAQSAAEAAQTKADSAYELAETKVDSTTYAGDKTTLENNITAAQTKADSAYELAETKVDSTTYDSDKATLEQAIAEAKASGDESVKDVKVNGTSVVEDGVADITLTYETELVNSEGEATTSTNAPTAKSVAEAIVQLRSDVTAIPKFKIQVVSELPTSEISLTTVYLLANAGTTGEQDVYSEYIYVDTDNNGTGDQWEKLGEVKVDMTQYYTKTEADALHEEHRTALNQLDKDLHDTLKLYYKATEIDSLLTGKVSVETYNARVEEVNGKITAAEGRIKTLEDWKAEFETAYASDKAKLEGDITKAQGDATQALTNAATAQSAADAAQAKADSAYELAETKVDAATYATEKAALVESIEAAQDTADEALAREIAFSADTYTKAKELATAEVIGQVILVKNEETITTGEEPNIVSNTYAAGPYIVVAAGEIRSLSTSTGDVDADIATQLGSRIGAVETGLGTLQQTHATDKEALEKAITDLETEINTTLEGYKVKDIKVDGVSVGEVWEVLTITDDDIDAVVNPKTQEPEPEA